MLSAIGYGLSPSGAQVTYRRFTLLSSLPPDLTYTRNDVVATRRDFSGYLQGCAAHQPRFDFDILGVPLGILIEGSRQNKCTNYNASPTNTIGLTTSAGSPTVSIVDDSAALSAVGLQQIGNTKAIKIDNSGQATSCSIDFSGTCGNTNPHSFSIWARETAGANGDLRRTGSGSNTVAITGSSYARYKLQNETPSSSSNTLRVRGNAGAVIYCLLNQLEEGAFTSSEIIVAGASGTRQQDDLKLMSLGNKIYFDEAQGFMTIHYLFNHAITSADQYLLVANNGTTAETLGIRIDSTNHVLRGYVRNSSTDRHASTNSDEILEGTLNAAGITWKSGEATILSDGLTNTQNYSGDPAGIGTLHIGALSSNTNFLWGHVQSFEIGSRFLSIPQLNAKLT